MKRKEKTLTKFEFQVMTILWDINQAACGRDILERFPEPKPTYTTIATYLKILLEKGFVEFFKREGEGKTQWYRPTITRQQYTRWTLQQVKDDFFGGSAASLVSFFAREDVLSDDDIAEIMDILNRKSQS